MTCPREDLTGYIDLDAKVLIETREDCAELRIPLRGTTKFNLAIAYCWMLSLPLNLYVSVDASDDEIMVSIDLNQLLFSDFDQDDIDRCLDYLRTSLVQWVHGRFLSLLSAHRYIFEDSDE
jgi:hypothetical protein